MKQFILKSLYYVASIPESVLSICNQDKKNSEHENFSDGLGLYNVSGKIMSKDEIEAESFETGLYDDY